MGIDEFSNLFYTVASFGSCRMTKPQIQQFQRLNRMYNEITGVNTTHTICNKASLMIKCKIILDEQNTKQTK